MKNIKLFLPTLLLFVFMASCSDDLVQKDYGSVNDQNVWKSSAALDEALNSGINQIDATWAYYTMFNILMEDGATDYWVGGANTAGEFSNFSQWKTGYPDPFDWGVWPAVWNSIFYSNLILDRVNVVPGLTESQKTIYIGDAKFIRAFNYYFLQNKFGGVPLVLSSADMRTSIHQSSQDSIKQQVEKDLIDASNSLPDKANIGANYSLPSKQAAFGLLARLYINWSTNPNRWQKASDACDAVINNPSGCGLVSDYSQIFALNNKNNAEMVYSLKHSAANNTTGGVFLLNDYFARPWDMVIPTSNQYEWGDWSVTPEFYQSFETGDARLKQITYTYASTQGGIVTNSTPIVVKYPLDPSAGGWCGGNDMPIIRYADIILMKAEAQNELGNLSDAINLVNQIRQRAGLVAISSSEFASKDALRDHIRLERRWEFFDEGLGRTDMIRFNTFLPWVAQKTVQSADTKYLVYPFSVGALQNNQGLIQNTGYLN